jgi:hypothetical protein
MIDVPKGPPLPAFWYIREPGAVGLGIMAGGAAAAPMQKMIEAETARLAG